MKNAAMRQRAIMRASAVSAVGNALLSLSKIAVGLMAGSLAVLSDGVDSAIDVVISLVMVVTARIISRPPSRKYAYGYNKAEGVATKVLSMAIFYAGIQMLVSSVESIFSAAPKQMPQPIAIYVILFSIAGKLLLALYQYRLGRRTDSSMLTANAVNMRSDVLISAGVLVGLAFTFFFHMPLLDSVTGLLVSLLIIRSAVKIFIDSNVELMDGVRDTSVYNKIFEAVERVPQAHNPHRVRMRQIGNLYMIDLDIEADGNLSLDQAHSIANQVENAIRQSIDVYDIVIHVEPVGRNHPQEIFGLDKNMIRE